MEKLTCPKCKSENIKRPGEFANMIADSTVTKMYLGFLHSLFEEKILKNKCRDCKHRW